MALGPPQLEARHRVYLDEARTHEVHAQSALGADGGLLVTSEFPAGSRDPAELVRTEARVKGEAELVRLVAELEERLAHTGSYLRADAADLRWSALPRPATRLDLRAHEAPIPGRADGATLRVHHFHAEAGEKDRLLVSMPRPGMTSRHVLARMDFEFPHVDEAEVEVLHARLAPPVLASAVAREHVEAPRRGLRKLFEPKDYERAYGARWAQRASVMYRRATARLVDAPVAPPPAHPVPDRLATMKAALSHARVEALRARYVDPVTEAMLVEGGEHVIRRHVAKLRARATHQQAYELSLLEATLLCEYAIPAQMWDLAADEGAKLLRWLHGYG